MALLFAFSLQEQVEKYGPYVGLAAFLGLAVLTVLYFAQARELKRLRDWAGRAPERAQELEARVVAQADELRRGPAEPAVERSGTVGPAQPVVRPTTASSAPSGNGRGTGTPVPIPPGPRPAVAVAAAAAQVAAAAATTQDEPGEAPEAPAESAPATAAVAAAETPTADEAVAPPDPEKEAAPAGNGAATTPPPIPRATPRPQPAPAPAAPLRASTSRPATVPPRRGTAVPARRDDDGSSRAARITMLTLAGVVTVAIVAFGATRILGGDDEPKPQPNVAQEPSASPDATGTTASVSEQRPDTVVVVLNGTATDGLASSIGEKLIGEGYSSEDGMIRTGNNTDQQRQDSVVLYARGKRRIARDVAQILGIGAPPEPVDADTLALANNTGENASGRETDVVVVAGADQAS
jgi:hypothetical protein